MASQPRKQAPKAPAHGRNRSALEESVTALAVGPESRMLVEAARTLADAVDDEGPACGECGRHPGPDDKLWREYRFALQALKEATSDGGSDDFASALDELRASIRNAENAKP